MKKRSIMDYVLWFLFIASMLLTYAFKHEIVVDVLTSSFGHEIVREVCRHDALACRELIRASR